ncbi:MAG: sensor histidine kinase, partial [Endomicrobiales bacterium]
VRAERKNLAKLLRGEIPKYHTEKRYVTKGGETVWASVTVSAVRDEREKFLCFLTFIENITERRRAEEALRKSEALFRLTFEESPVGMAMVDMQFKFIRVNDAYCRIVGYTEKELLARALVDVTHPDDASRDRENLRRIRQDGINKYGVEKRFIKKNGEIVWGSVTVAVVRDAQGKFLYNLGIVENITERKRAEEALRESEERYRSIFENAPLGIFHSTARGKLISVNPAYARQMGYSSPEEVVAAVNRTSVAECLYVHPKLRPIFVRRTLALGGWHEYENLYRRKDGQVMEGLVRFRSIPKTAGTGAELEGFLEDISARKKAEEELRLYQEKLRVLSMQLAFVEEKERQRLANNIHDYITQSLSCALLDLGSLENEIGQNPKAMETLRKVRGQVEQGIQQMRSVTAELSPAILFKLGFEAVVEWLADRLLEPRGIRCQIKSRGSLKITDNEVSVILYRAVRELLMNIVKHAKARQVSITLRSDRNFLEITVRDDGAGFDVLRAAKKTEGFGLFSVREQLAYIGGGMSIESKAGRGTTVRILSPFEAKKRAKGGEAPGRKA